MNELLFLILLIIISYLTGSTPTSIIIGRIAKNIDIREHGSGNALPLPCSLISIFLAIRPIIILVGVEPVR